MRQMAKALAVLLVALAAAATAPAARAIDGERIFEAIVGLDVEVPAEARTARFLGTAREGSGVVIGDDLILTIGYLIVESSKVQIVLHNGRTLPGTVAGYDHASGFGLVRSLAPLNLRPLALGEAKGLGVSDQVLVATRLGPAQALGAYIVSRRTFAGGWEYVLDRAIFTAPPHPAFGGAALVNTEGKLVGIGSLLVTDAASPGRPSPGNMFVPIDELTPILADLRKTGKRAGPERPWLGITAEPYRGRVFVGRVAEDSPASKAGIAEGDMLLAVAGKPVSDLVEFFRAVWAIGPAGVAVPITVLDAGGKTREVTLGSVGRNSWFRTDKGL
ncbi:MAG: S1C family serine protease [Alphaproteobacteria bacterium]